MVFIISLQNLWAGKIAKSTTSEGNSALLNMNVGWRLPFKRGLMTFQLQNFHLYDKPLEDWSLRKQFILFPSNLNVSLSFPLGNNEILRNKITCSATVGTSH